MSKHTESLTSVSVSTIIPTLNSENFLARAIDSVLKQDFNDIEIVIVDGGSTDKTFDIAKSYGENVRWVYEPIPSTAKTSGLAAARNRGISESRGTYIAFLDSDDEWLPHKTSFQLSLFEKHPELGLVSGAALNINPDGSVRRERRPKKMYGYILPTIIGYNPVFGCTVMIRREILTGIKSLFALDLNMAEDWQFWIRLSARWPFYISSGVLAKRHLREESLAHTYDDPFEHVNYVNELYESLWSDPLLLDYRNRHRRKVDSIQKISGAYIMCSHNKIRQAIKSLIKATLLYPFNLKIIKGYVKCFAKLAGYKL